MNAIRIHEFGEPSVLKYEDIPKPIPSPGQVVVRVEAIGVNPVDGYIRAGKYGPRTFPFTPGSDAAGVIEVLGENVASFKIGDRVYGHGAVSGTYAEFALCDATQVHPLPETISFEEGAGVGVPYFTAQYALTLRGQAQRGETVLIHGASGGVGTAALQIARILGLTIIATAGSEKGKEHVRQQGAHHVLNHKAPDYLDELMKITEGRGVHLILEMLANVNLGKDLKILAKRGRVVVIGSRGPVEIDPRDTMGRNASILGMSSFNATPDEHRACHAAIGLGLKQGVLRPVIGKMFMLTEAAQAQVSVMEPGAFGKIILRP
jgi:NADPH2:quinone reductase